MCTARMQSFELHDTNDDFSCKAVHGRAILRAFSGQLMSNHWVCKVLNI